MLEHPSRPRWASLDTNDLSRRSWRIILAFNRFGRDSRRFL